MKEKGRLSQTETEESEEEMEEAKVEKKKKRKNAKVREGFILDKDYFFSFFFVNLYGLRSFQTFQNFEPSLMLR